MPFSIANEAVKRNKNDNRRLVNSPIEGGNDFFYLGTPNHFIAKFDEPLRSKLIEVQNKCEVKFKKRDVQPRTLQRGEGIKVKHKIKKELLLSLLPFLDSYLDEYVSLYQNVNFNKLEIINKINNVQDEFIRFTSDLVFIKDSKWAKPYFKWFNYPETYDNFKLIKEFFIPQQSFLNFQIDNYENDTINTTWELSYTMSVIYTSENLDAIVSKAIENLPTNDKDVETIREAITKIRIGQSQFRTNLLNSERNKCLITGIQNPDLLIASHIKPWKKSNNTERLDPNNGILFTPTFDKLFDKFLITFNENGSIVLSQNRLDDDTKNKLRTAYPNLDKSSVVINQENKIYLDYHRKVFLEKETGFNTNDNEY